MAVDDSYTKSLLHFNGADASTDFTDESGKTWTAYDNAQIDTAQSKFGGASGLFDGTGDYIDTPDHADFDVGSGDFTIDLWIRPAAIDQVAFLFGQAASDVSARCVDVALLADESVNARMYVGVTEYQSISATGVYAANTWLHIAVVRYGNLFTLYTNGTGATPVDVTGVTVIDRATKFAIGRPGEHNGYYYNGWIDEFRFSKGVARWTSNFTPPLSAYPYVGGFFKFSS